MPQHFVCLTFDYDNASPMIARDMTTPTMISRGDFGVVATERLMALLGKHCDRLDLVHPRPHHRDLSRPRRRPCTRPATRSRHHGWTHRVPASLGPRGGRARAGARQRSDRGADRRAARGYRSPAWDLSPHSIELLLKHGFVYDSSLMGHDYLPYQARDGDVVSCTSRSAMGPTPRSSRCRSAGPRTTTRRSNTCGRRTRPAVGSDERHVGRRRTGSPTSATWPTTTTWGVLTYTFHPHVIGRGHRLIMLEGLIENLAAAGAKFVTMEQAVGEYRTRYPNGRSEPGA